MARTGDARGGWDDLHAWERQTWLWLALLCGPLMAAGWGITAMMASPEPVRLLDTIVTADIVEIRNERGEALLSGEFRTRTDALGNIERDAELRDARGRAVIGEVELETPAPNRVGRRPELEVDIMGLPPRETFVVAIDNRVVARFTTDDRGSVDLELQEGEAPAGRDGP